MNCLAIDTSGNHLTVLLIKGEEVYESHVNNAFCKHSVTLMPEIEKILLKTDTKLSDIDVFCASVGPGSFTGIRIGVSTVKALAYSCKKKVLGVTSFLSLAYNSDENEVLSVIDAKHENYYVCGFEDKKISLNPCFLTVEEIKELSKKYQVVCDGDVEIPHLKGDYKIGFYKAVKNSLNNATFNVEELVPLYVKKSQAEEERNG